MLFCIDTGAHISCIGNKAFKNIISQTGCTAILLVKSEHNFRFGDTTMRSKGMVKHILPIPEGYPDISILLDVVNANIPALLGIDALDGKILFLDNASGHLWNRIIINRKQLRHNDGWKMMLIRKGDHLYISLIETIQSF